MPTDDAAIFGKVAMWLAFADAITRTVGAARLHDYFFVELHADARRGDAHKLFRLLEETLWFHEQEEQAWLCSRVHPTIADIACFPYVILSEEGGISREDYPAIRRWTERVRRIPGFVAMPGIFPAAPLD
jgi:glutathione S-transferase